MMNKPTSILNVLVLAGLALQPLDAAAQGSRAPAPAPAPAARPSRVTTAPAPAPAARPTAAVTSPRSWTEQEYRLGPGDKLRVEVYGQPQLSQSLQVRPDGKITVPLVGDTVAAGRTSIELRDALTTSLKEYVTNPVVTVIVQEATSNQIDVIGEVGSPGPQTLTGPLSVLQAIGRAGGLKEFAKKRDIRILRMTGGSTPTTIDFDYKDALNGRIPPLYVQPGDTIVVP